MASRPVLSSIPAFDARFGTEGYGNIEVPVLKFSLEYGAYVARKNRVVIYDYNNPSNCVYDCTIETMKLEHKLHRTLSDAESTEGIVQQCAFNLSNNNKYIAKIYVMDQYGKWSESSNEIIFYCYDTPVLNFINFNNESEFNIPVVNSTSISFAVLYDENNQLPINSYVFELLDHQGNILNKSDTKYNINPGEIFRWAIGGVEATEKDENGELRTDMQYTIVCKGETKHGFVFSIKQDFVVILDVSGVGALIKAKNLGDGTVAINSNYKIMNANCSTEEPVYLNDGEGKPYAIDLTGDDFVEYTDGFVIKQPWEIIIKGEFEADKLVTLRNERGEEGYVCLNRVTYTTIPYYYFSYSINLNDVLHEVTRSEYFVYDKNSLVCAKLDLSYNNNFYSLLVDVDYKDATCVVSDNDMGDVGIYFINKDVQVSYENDNLTLTNDSISVEYTESISNVLIKI